MANYGTDTPVGAGTTGWGGWLIAHKITIVGTVTLQSVSLITSANGTGHFYGAIYDSNGTGGGPGTRLAATGNTLINAGDPATSTANLLATTDVTDKSVWVAVLPENNGVAIYYLGTGGTLIDRTVGVPYATPPDPYGTITTTTYQVSIYATGTASGGGGAVVAGGTGSVGSTPQGNINRGTNNPRFGLLQSRFHVRSS